MTELRSALYFFYLYFSAAVIGIVFWPAALVWRHAALLTIRTWVGSALFVLRWLVGVRLVIEGREHIPDGPVLAAGKHQAMLDTMAPFAIFANPAMVLKQELTQVPIYGWYVQRSEQIPVDREAQASAMRTLLRAARNAKKQGRPIVIFPEGTRQELGARGTYKPGVAALYKDLGVPCVPFALTTGLCWPARGMRMKPGTVRIRFLPAIAPGLSRENFMTELETRIETAQAALMAERS